MARVDAVTPAWAARARCHPHLVLQFYRELATMLENGVPLDAALDLQGRHSSDPVMKRVLQDLHARISQGWALSKAFAAYPAIFTQLAVSLARMGETSGLLTDQLAQLAAWSQRDDRLVRQLKSALTYPLFCMALTALLTLLLFTWVVPGFADIFQQLHAALPWPTRLLLAITRLVTSPWFWLAAVIVIPVAGTQARALLATSGGRQLSYRLMLTVPLLGRLLRSVAIARFCGACQTMLGSGQNLVLCARVSLDASGSPVLQANQEDFLASLKNGRSLAEHFAAFPELYPPTLTHMIRSGEEASSAVEMFGLVARHFDEEAQHSIAQIGALIEPVMMAGVALIVGSILVSIFLPLYGVLGKLSE